MPRHVPIGPKPGPEQATPPRVPEPSAPPIPAGIPKPAQDPDKPKSPGPIPHHGADEIPLRFRTGVAARPLVGLPARPGTNGLAIGVGDRVALRRHLALHDDTLFDRGTLRVPRVRRR
jgi:hypothetical protein